jgi:hypothetical protein
MTFRLGDPPLSQPVVYSLRAHSKNSGHFRCFEVLLLLLDPRHMRILLHALPSRTGKNVKPYKRFTGFTVSALFQFHPCPFRLWVLLTASPRSFAKSSPYLNVSWTCNPWTRKDTVVVPQRNSPTIQPFSLNAAWRSTVLQRKRSPNPGLKTNPKSSSAGPGHRS